MKTTRLLTAALILPCCASLASAAATIVAQYQYNPNGDWFGDPTPLGPFPAVELVGHPQTDSSNVNNIWNYATTSAITQATVSGDISGQGLNYVVQTRNAGLLGGTNAGSLFLRGNFGRFAFRTQTPVGGGATTLVWSDAIASTALTGLTYNLSIGPASGGGGPADWEDGMRLAMQDTGGNWHLSDWTSNGKVPIEGGTPVSGTLAGLYSISLDTVEWAPYGEASLASGALITFDAGSAAFAPFGGDAQAFGFYTQQESFGNGELRMRMNGFQVVVPEPGSVLLLGLGGMLCARRRRRA